MTLIEHRVSEATYDKALDVPGEKYLAGVIMVIIIINAWNRIGVATGIIPAAIA